MELLQKGLRCLGADPISEQKGPGIRGQAAGLGWWLNGSAVGVLWGGPLPLSPYVSLICRRSLSFLPSHVRTQTDPRLCEVECWGLANLSDYAERRKAYSITL